MAANQNNRDIHNQYSGENAYGKIRVLTEDAERQIDSAMGDSASLLFRIVATPFKMFVTALLFIVKGVFKVPARFLFFGFLINYLLYKPLTYFFEELLNRNCPILFDPNFLTHVGVQTLGGSFPSNGIASYVAAMVGSVSAWFNIGANLDQGLSYIVLFFACATWHFGKSALLGRSALRIYSAFNFIGTVHLIYKGYLISTLEGNFSSWTEGNVLLATFFASLCVCLTAYALNEKINKAFTSNNLNSLGETPGGFVDTLTADNNLKTPIQS